MLKKAKEIAEKERSLPEPCTMKFPEDKFIGPKPPPENIFIGPSNDDNIVSEEQKEKELKELEQILLKVRKDLAENQEPLGEEFGLIIEKNIHTLYKN